VGRRRHYRRFLDDLRDDWGWERLLVEDMLARAIAELGR
jgi:hypothetical protein